MPLLVEILTKMTWLTVWCVRAADGMRTGTEDVGKVLHQGLRDSFPRVQKSPRGIVGRENREPGVLAHETLAVAQRRVTDPVC